MKEKAQELRKELKAIGISNKDVSVRVKPCTYSEVMDVKIKNLDVDIRKVQELAMKYEEINRDEFSGEILSGGNDFVFVDYDFQILQEDSKKYISVAEEILKNELKSGEGITISKTDKYELVFWKNQPNQIIVYSKGFEMFDGKWIKFPAYDAFALAESLSLCHHLYGFNY